MKPDFSNGVPPEVLRRIRGEQDEVKDMESKSYFCPYCRRRPMLAGNRRADLSITPSKDGEEATG